MISVVRMSIRHVTIVSQKICGPEERMVNGMKKSQAGHSSYHQDISSLVSWPQRNIFSATSDLP